MRIWRGAIGVTLGLGSLAALVSLSCIGAAPPVATSSGEGGSSPSGGDGASGGCPGPERCGNHIDDNCNGEVDEGCDCTGVPEGTQRACGQAGPGICTLGSETCKDNSWTECTGVAPHATEDTCDGKDENCNGQVDEGLTIACLHDIDHDGYPNTSDKKDVCPDPAAAAAPRYGCPVDYIRASQSPGNDCNDGDPSIKPGVQEHCDAVDWDCDGNLRNGCPSTAVTYGAVASSGIYGITATVSGCGTQVYASSSTSCAAGGAVGLSGYSGGAFTAPTQLSLTCNAGTITETVATPEYTYKLARNGANTTSPLTGPGRADDTFGTATCNPGDWVIGIKYTSSCLFDRMTIICAPISYIRNGATWSATPGAESTQNVLGNFGSLQQETTFTCPAGSVLSELTEWHTTGTANDSNYVSGMKFGCRPLGYVPQ